MFDQFGDCIQAHLAKYFNKPGSLVDADALLEADWSRAWMGWLELSEKLSEMSNLFQCHEQYVARVLQSGVVDTMLKRFLRIASQNHDVEAPMDEEHLKVLEREYTLMRSEVYGRNDCLADSCSHGSDNGRTRPCLPAKPSFSVATQRRP